MQNNSTIKPADIALTRLAPEQQAAAAGKYKRPVAIGAGLFVLAALVFAVLFILPDWQEEDSAADASATVTSPADGAVTPTPPRPPETSRHPGLKRNWPGSARRLRTSCPRC